MNIPQPIFVKVPQDLRGMSFWKQFIYSWGNPPTFMLHEDWEIDLDLKYPIIIPKGFVTDFATIPKFLWSFLAPDGDLALGAIVHDFIFQYGYLLTKYNPEITYQDSSNVARLTYTPLFEDLIPVYIGLPEDNANFFLKSITDFTSGNNFESNAAFTAVMLRGKVAWKNYRTKGNGFDGPETYNKNSLHLPGLYVRDRRK